MKDAILRPFQQYLSFQGDGKVKMTCCVQCIDKKNVKMIFHEWSFHMEFMKRGFGEFHKFHII